MRLEQVRSVEVGTWAAVGVDTNAVGEGAADDRYVPRRFAPPALGVWRLGPQSIGDGHLEICQQRRELPVKVHPDLSDFRDPEAREQCAGLIGGEPSVTVAVLPDCGMQ